jgi:hypothetical protein
VSGPLDSILISAIFGGVGAALLFLLGRLFRYIVRLVRKK